MILRAFVGCIALVSASAVSAFEQGDLVVARGDVSLTLDGKETDQIGPGQVLRILTVKGDRLWVSRGQPGWIDAADVIELPRAEAFFDKALAAGASSHDYLARGTVRIALGKHEQGIADLEKAIELATKPGDFIEPLAYAQLAANQQPAAIETFNRALREQPDSTPALMGRGLAYYQVGQYRNAIADLSRAIEQDPDHGFPRKYLGALYHDIGQRESARQQLDAAVRIDKYDVFTRRARGRLLFDLGEYDASQQEFGIAMNIDPSDVEAVAGRGVVRHAIGKDLAGAAADFAKAIELADESLENAYLWSNLGQVKMELGESDQALKNLNKAVELDPNFTEARSHRAYLLLSNAPLDAAALELAKSDVSAVFASREPRTYWDYRAAAAANAALDNYQRAAKYEALGEAILRKTGPQRFVQASVAARQRYERAEKR